MKIRPVFVRYLNILIIIALMPLLCSDLCIAQDLQQSSELHASGAISKILKISAAAKKGLTKLPSLSSVTTQSSSSSSKVSSSDFSIKTVSGTPPTLQELADLPSVKEIFWKLGVVDHIIDGTATERECREFFAGMRDGDSGGIGACHMAEDVAHGFQNILSSDVSACYMRSLPTKANLKSGGITLEAGKFPSNDVTKLFSVGSASRLIKVNVEPFEPGAPTEHIFITIASKSQNKSADLFFSATLYFCGDGETEARGYNTIQVTNRGQYIFNAANSRDPFGGDASVLVSASGYLDPSGKKTAWDPDRPRTSSLQVVSDRGSIKADLSISGGQLTQKTKASHDDIIHNNYTISSYSGSSVTDLRFLEGGYKGQTEFSDFSQEFNSAAEWRDVIYYAAPSSEFFEQAEDVDIDGDQFYTSLPSFTVDVTPYSCTALPDIEISMHKNDTLETALKPCFQNRFTDIEFCRRDEAVQAALRNFNTTCNGRFPQPPPP